MLDVSGSVVDDLQQKGMPFSKERLIGECALRRMRRHIECDQHGQAPDEDGPQ